MADSNRPEAADLQAEIRGFRDGFRTLVLATTGPEGEPEASVAPYLRGEDGALYVYLSSLARHTANLRVCGRVAVLFAEDEAGLKNPFARRRLSLLCEVEAVPREAPEFGPTLDGLARRFGSVVEVLRGLGDFQLFRLVPRSGTYVRGFAQAFALRGPDLEDARRVVPDRPSRRTR